MMLALARGSMGSVGFDVVQDEKGLHDRGRAARAAAQLDQDLPGPERGGRSFALGTDSRVRPVDRVLPAPAHHQTAAQPARRLKEQD